MANILQEHDTGGGISPATSQKLKNMGLFCACLVVAIHVDWHPDSGNVCWFLHNYFKKGVCLIAVPFFFVVSGFFLAKHFGEVNWWKVAVKKRIKSLIVPFYCWTGLYIVLTAPASIVADHIAGRSFGTSLVWMHDWIWTLGLDFTRPTMTPLWYLRCLFVFVMMSAFLKILMDRLGYVFLVILVILGLGCEYLPKSFLYDILTEGMLPNCGPALGVFYFVTGMFLQTRSHELKYLFGLSHKKIMLCIVCIISLGVGIFLVPNNHLKQIMLLVAIALLMGTVYYIMPSTRLPKRIIGLSLPIYLTHMPVIVYLSAISKHITSNLLLQSGFVFVVTILCSITLSLLLKTLTPKFASIVFGGR